jgi:hypothetical protein
MQLPASPAAPASRNGGRKLKIAARCCSNREDVLRRMQASQALVSGPKSGGLSTALPVRTRHPLDG